MLQTTKPGKCKFCRLRLEKIGQKLHDECVSGWWQANQQKVREKAAKAERARTRVRKAAIQTLPELKKLAQRSFNAYIRERDKEQRCICCGNELGAGDIGGAYDAGHYRSVGSAPHLRFNEANVHGQRKHCNRYGAGRAVDFRIGLIARIGLEAVEALEADHAPKHYRHDDLRAIAATYKQKLRELKEKE